MNETFTILIADDNLAIRTALSTLLRLHFNVGKVMMARDGREALESLQVRVPDVIMMDISMPGMDGISATKAIMSQWPSAYIIALSMSDDDEKVSAILEAGAREYLLKSSDVSEFARVLRKVQSQPAA